MNLILNILNSKFTHHQHGIINIMVSSTVMILVPLCTCTILLSTYRRLKKDYEKTVLFYKRHNCVVMYSQIKGMGGWPPYTERVRIDLKKENCLDVFHEPILYFINTASKSLDAAFMLIGINSVYSALIEAHKRGVKIRVLLNFEHCHSTSSAIERLLNEGIEVLTYVSKPGISSIMHYKFMIKDYGDLSGFVLTGSLNLTESGFLNNFENIAFISNQYVARNFHENFEKCWNLVQLDNMKFN